MYALWFIAKQNLKRKRGDVAVLFLLIALATILLYTSISVLTGIDEVISQACDRSKSADFIAIAGGEGDELANILKSHQEVEVYEASEALAYFDAEYRKEGEEESESAELMFSRAEEKRSIGIPVSKEYAGQETIALEKEEILLPYYMKAAKGYKVGDIIYILLGSSWERFCIAGFTEDPMFSTPLNISMYSAYISGSRFDDLLAANDNPEKNIRMVHKVHLKENNRPIDFEQKITPEIVKGIGQKKISVIAFNRETMSGGTGLMSRLSMGVILIFSLLLIIITLLVIRFSIRNFIEGNLKNIGILQAAGYTTRQLQNTVLLEMGSITFLGLLVGICLGIAGSGIVGSFEGIMLGLSWQRQFSAISVALTIVTMLIVVGGVSFGCGRLYRRLTVLEALRGGIHTHNFKKNHLSLAKSRLPLSAVLAGKTILMEKGKTISTFFIVTLLSLATCMGFGLYENFALHKEELLKLTGMETGNIVMSGADLEQAVCELSDFDEVEKVLRYQSNSLQLESKSGQLQVACDMWNEPKLIENEILIRGRLPEYENEIVLTASVAKILGVDAGDTIYVTGAGERKSMLISGIDQKINNMGQKCMISSKGAQYLNGSFQTAMLYVYTKEGVSYDAISKKVSETFPDMDITDSEKFVTETMGGVVLAMKAICVLFVGITVFVVMLVEILLVKSQIIREKKNIGINKALGFSTRDIIFQTFLKNVPVLGVAAVCGVALSFVLGESMIVACLSFCGIEKYSLVISAHWLLITVAGILTVASVTAFFSALRVRKIVPVQLLTEE